MLSCTVFKMFPVASLSSVMRLHFLQGRKNILCILKSSAPRIIWSTQFWLKKWCIDDVEGYIFVFLHIVSVDIWVCWKVSWLCDSTGPDFRYWRSWGTHTHTHTEENTLLLLVLVATITDLKDFSVGIKMGRNEVSLFNVSLPYIINWEICALPLSALKFLASLSPINSDLWPVPASVGKTESTWPADWHSDNAGEEGEQLCWWLWPSEKEIGEGTNAVSFSWGFAEKDGLWVIVLAQWLTLEREEREESRTSSKPDSLKVKLWKIIALIGLGKFGVQFKDRLIPCPKSDGSIG